MRIIIAMLTVGMLSLILVGMAMSQEAVDERAKELNSYNRETNALEEVMERFYRGESIEEARRKLNLLVDEHNGLVEARNREIKAEEEQLQEQLKPLRKIEKELDAMDEKLSPKPDRSDEEAVRAYNALVERRNALMKETSRLNRQANVSIKAHNARVKRIQAKLSAWEKELKTRRAKLDARIAAYKDFHESGEDVAFFASVNRLLARLRRKKRRSEGSQGWDALIARVCGIRCELGAHAIARHGNNEIGLIVAEAVLNGTEPCFFIVDTGAMRTTLCPWLVDALGLAERLGEEVEMVLAGGAKLKGRECILPRITVAGKTAEKVSTVVVAVSEVGVDGLLGQSFLKRFIYTIDETQSQPLILRVRDAF